MDVMKRRSLGEDVAKRISLWGEGVKRRLLGEDMEIQKRISLDEKRMSLGQNVVKTSQDVGKRMSLYEEVVKWMPLEGEGGGGGKGAVKTDAPT